MTPSERKSFTNMLAKWRERPDLMVRELFGVEPDAWQDEALRLFPKAPRLAMKACKGPGKLQPKSMAIETPAGPRIWGDLRIGDEVFAEDGSPTKITGTYDNGVVPVFRVTFDDGSSTLAGAEHLWKVQGRTERRKGLGWAVLTTQQIVERGVLVPNGKWTQKQFIIPRQGAAQFPAVDLPVDPYLTGVWIGDGSKGQPSYCKPYVEVEHEINRRGYLTSRASDGNQVRVHNAVREFQQIECFDRGSHERFIPDLFKRSAVVQRRDLLCGLMDTDGRIGDDGHMEYSTTSARLADDVVWLVRSLGGSALIKQSVKEGAYKDANGDRVVCRDCYRVSVCTDFNPFLIPHKAERWRDPTRGASTERYLTRFIASIEPEGEADSMCIEVAHPSRCYLANDFIVTHNTTTLAWLGWNYLLTRPFCNIGAISITVQNLADGLWKEMAKWQEKAPLLKQMFTWTKTRIFANEAPATWFMSAKSWPKTASTEEQAKALAGFHADYVMFLIDESGGMTDAIMVSAEAAFAGTVECHIVQAGNPTQLSGPLYRACTSSRDLWTVITITGDPDDPNRSPRIPIEYAREQIRQWGRDNNWVRTDIFGEFPSSSINALIGQEEVEAATKRYYREFEIGRMPKIMGIDVARFGNDSSSIAKRQGIQMFPFEKRRNIDSLQGASWVNREWSMWGADAAFIDATGGFGSGWEDQLRVLGRSPIGVHFSSQAANKTKFFNKRSEMAFEFVEWIKRGGALPGENVQLTAALTQTTYTFQNDRLLLEPKDMVKSKLGYSPDDFDSAILTFAEPITLAAPSRRGGRMLVDYDPYAVLDERRESAPYY